MKIVTLSDTHEKHNYITEFPDGDVFIFAGDFTMFGEFDWVSNFNAWLKKLPYKYKLVIAGNHDRSLDIDEGGPIPSQNAKAYGQEKLNNATYLLHNGIEIDGKKFWGSPYTPFFASNYWKFSYDRAEGANVWEPIPESLDVLITHGPPKYAGDKTMEGDFVGCWDLNRRILEQRPKHHIFGHIHEGFGTMQSGYTTYHNVSAVDRKYRLRENPWTIFDI